jgi:hypothetical protein
MQHKSIVYRLFLIPLIWGVFSCGEEVKEIAFETNVDLIESIEETPISYSLSYSNDSAYTEFIKGLTDVQREISIIEDPQNPACFRCNMNFESYFSLFDQLSIASNWELEAHYRHFGDAGRILLLGFEDNDAYGESIKKALYGSFHSTSNYPLSQNLIEYEDSVQAMDAVQVWPSKMGYFQFAVFGLIGTNICNFGHSNYGEMSIFTSAKELEDLIAQEDDFYYHFSEEEEAIILEINPEPEIEITDDYAKVSLLTLGPWDGFNRYHLSISTTWPRQFEKVEIDTILDYNCGILF